MNFNHPKDVGLSYLQHLKFAWNESIHALWMTIVMFIHGIVPWIWDWKFNHYLGEAKKRAAPQHENRKKN